VRHRSHGPARACFVTPQSRPSDVPQQAPNEGPIRPRRMPSLTRPADRIEPGRYSSGPSGRPLRSVTAAFELSIRRLGSAEPDQAQRNRPCTERIGRRVAP